MKKSMIIHSIVGLIKKHCKKMNQYFPKPCRILKETLMPKWIYLIMQ